MPESLLSVALSAPAGKQSAGEPIRVTIEVRNISGHAIWIVGALDGSDTGLRFPHYLPRINGAPPPLSGEEEYLDVASPLRPEDFRQLQPGDGFDPVARLNLTLNPLLAHFTEFVPPAPGHYELRLTLSTESDQDEQWLGIMDYPGKDEALRRLASVPRLRIESNALVIEAK
jgi:hypothetical protein